MSDPATTTSPEAKPRFHALRIARVERDAADGMHVTFEVPAEARAAFRFRPGQHLTVRATIDGAEARRSYSICSGPRGKGGDGALEVTIKRVEDGVFSSWAHGHLKAGAVLDVMPPSGRFTLPAPVAGAADGGVRTYLAVCAGSGITPVISMIRHVLADEPASHFVLIYGNRTTGSILFRDALDDLKDTALGRLTVVHVLSRGDEADVPMLAGRIDAAKLTALVPKLVPVASITHAVLCGPDTLIKTAMAALQVLGVPREKIGFEFFVRGRDERGPRVEKAKAAVAEAEAQGTELVVALDGSRRTIRMRPDETILEAALRSGANAPYSCRGGMCCTCRAKLVEGLAAMDANFSLEAWEERQGFILTCQARPKSARVVVDYDQV